MKLHFLGLFLLLSAAVASDLQGGCSTDPCLQYSANDAAYVVNFATCSNVVTKYVNKLNDWSYKFCLKAQIKEYV
jgi:hypothetical protein